MLLIFYASSGRSGELGLFNLTQLWVLTDNSSILSHLLGRGGLTLKMKKLQKHYCSALNCSTFPLKCVVMKLVKLCWRSSNPEPIWNLTPVLVTVMWGQKMGNCGYWCEDKKIKDIKNQNKKQEQERNDDSLGNSVCYCCCFWIQNAQTSSVIQEVWKDIII